MIHDVWVEIDLAALRHNTRQVRSLIGPDVGLMAVVKGDGYGHGRVEASKAFVSAGANALAVTRLDEAVELRQSGITCPILAFAPIQRENAIEAVEAGIDLTVDSAELTAAVSDAAVQRGREASVHVKVDTGMGRLGLLPEDVLGFFESVKSLPGVQLAGIYTHFANAADRTTDATLEQFRTFQSVLRKLKQSDILIGTAHAANSAALLRFDESRLDMVRSGTLLYGQYPSPHVPRRLELKNTWKLKARVSVVRILPRGSKVGYGSEFVTTRRTSAAVIPVGYADGFSLTPEGPVYRQSFLRFAAKKRRSSYVLFNGTELPVLGRIAMQMCVVDATEAGGIKPGDEVTIPARRIPTGSLVHRVYVDSDAEQDKCD